MLSIVEDTTRTGTKKVRSFLARGGAVMPGLEARHRGGVHGHSTRLQVDNIV